MGNFDLTKLSGNELLELRTKISKEIDARENTKKNELAEAIIQSFKAYTDEFGGLMIEFDYNDNRVYFSDKDKYNFYPEDDMIIVN